MMIPTEMSGEVTLLALKISLAGTRTYLLPITAASHAPLLRMTVDDDGERKRSLVADASTLNFVRLFPRVSPELLFVSGNYFAENCQKCAARKTMDNFNVGWILNSKEK